MNTHGDFIHYAPKTPYKGESSSFYAFYYEHINRYDKIQERSAKNSKIQYWTPNKEIHQFGYANEFTLDECEKRGIEVHFGWEMIKVEHNEYGEKIATFKNVDTGEIIQNNFTTLVTSAPSKPHDLLV
jgi:hypothetical protein